MFTGIVTVFLITQIRLLVAVQSLYVVHMIVHII
jgi:hypothetical protein